ncbi:MAG TPA: hypothetical protein VLE99_06455 [Candidatus Saccharimonadales bacterium]|nr:hypothetical protein [Candidatus Saccharimonadales bacterium]
MKRSGIIIAVIVVLAVAGGVFALMHNSSKDNGSTSKTSEQSTVPPINNDIVVTKTDGTVGQYLADATNGKALYTYNPDTNGVSKCTGSCLANWPAYVATGSTANLPDGFATIKRSDNGQTQYTYNGKPLYFFITDSSGRVTGDGVENFSVAKPVAASTPSTGTSTNNSSNSGNSSSPNYTY